MEAQSREGLKLLRKVLRVGARRASLRTPHLEEVALSLWRATQSRDRRTKSIVMKPRDDERWNSYLRKMSRE